MEEPELPNASWSAGGQVLVIVVVVIMSLFLLVCVTCEALLYEYGRNKKRELEEHEARLQARQAQEAAEAAKFAPTAEFAPAEAATPNP